MLLNGYVRDTATAPVDYADIITKLSAPFPGVVSDAELARLWDKFGPLAALRYAETALRANYLLSARGIVEKLTDDTRSRALYRDELDAVEYANDHTVIRTCRRIYAEVHNSLNRKPYGAYTAVNKSADYGAKKRRQQANRAKRDADNRDRSMRQHGNVR